MKNEQLSMNWGFYSPFTLPILIVLLIFIFGPFLSFIHFALSLCPRFFLFIHFVLTVPQCFLVGTKNGKDDIEFDYKLRDEIHEEMLHQGARSCVTPYFSGHEYPTTDRDHHIKRHSAFHFKT